MSHAPHSHDHDHPHDDPSEAQELLSLDRRTFVGLVGGAAGLITLGNLAGCIRRPVETTLPYAQRPEELIPGRPLQYATALELGGEAVGVLVESHDGRPTKIAGNPQHPASLGATNAWGQAEILALYDPDRSRKPKRRGADATWEQFGQELDERVASLANDEGQALGLVLESTTSPTVLRLVGEARRRWPKMAIYQLDPYHVGRAAGRLRALFAGTRPVYDLARADVVVAIDADPLGIDPGAVRTTHDFAARRKADAPGDTMNRLYVVEPAFTVTGLMADHRLRRRASEVPQVVAALAAELFFGHGLAAPTGSADLVVKLKGASVTGEADKLVKALARDLVRARGRSLVLVGHRQAPEVQALAALVNRALGSVGTTVRYVNDPWATLGVGSAADLAADLDANRLKTLLVLGGNPAYGTSAHRALADKLASVPFVAVLSSHIDETASAALWQLPKSHALEAWGDVRTRAGVASIVQPLIAPLFDSRSEVELLDRLLGAGTSGYDLVRATWSEALPTAVEGTWSRWLHDGVVAQSAADPVVPSFAWKEVAAALPPAPVASHGLEAVFALDYSVFDGRYANNPWLQEMPDPITKLTWDNAALLGPATAKRLGVAQGDRVRLAVAGQALDVAVFISPGVADDTVILPIGYGRKGSGRFGHKAGFDVGGIRRLDSPWIQGGVELTKVAGTYKLATTQSQDRMEGRPILRSATLLQYRAEPELVKQATPAIPANAALWTPPNKQDGMQWGMSIDLGACTGCSACVVACQSENNTSVVGKEQVSRGRTLHWIRVDRYYEGDENDPRAAVQPVNCQQCENAPCESVCPVNATSHSPEGLNDQAYNRCIGTRYCANNCPYKVRRFNFFNYVEDLTPIEKMPKNPDVTVRLRGVMEKCTYCVQRINEARIQAKEHGDGTIADGGVKTACQEVCPAGAISFGNINDANAEVTRKKELARNYALLEELNTRPRTTYLAKITNPNPELAS
ncbi:MAG: 4Fe-4S dicluster domain-containing protein [Myxococcota bacterium]